MARQSPCTTAALQAARRQVQSGSQFVQCESGGAHHICENSLREAFPNGRLKISFAPEQAAQRRLATQLFDDGMKFVYHSVAYYSAKCLLPELATHRSRDGGTQPGD